MFKKEVYLGMSFDNYVMVKRILDENGIPYSIKIKSLDGSDSSFFSGFFGSSRRSMGMMNTTQNNMKEYRILVKQEFYDQAVFVLNQQKLR